MTKSTDIANLFARFGGRPDTYQEIASTNSLDEARKRWPLLRAIDGEKSPDEAPEPVRPLPIQREKPLTEPMAAVKKSSVRARPDGSRGADRSSTGVGRSKVVRPDVPAVADPVPKTVRQTAQPVVATRVKPSGVTPAERPISEVFSKLASKSRQEAEPEPELEPAKPSGLFGSLRRVVRK